MFSCLSEYGIETSLNPFKLNMERKQMKGINHSQINFLTLKKKLFLSNSTPKLRLLYNPQLPKQSNSTNTDDTQSLKQLKIDLFHFKNHQKQYFQHCQQKYFQYESSLITNKNCQNLISSDQIIRNNQSDIQSPLSMSKMIHSKLRLPRKELMGKKSTIIKRLPSIKNLSIFKTQKPNNLQSPKDIRKSSLETILKTIKRRDQNCLKGSLRGSKMLNNNFKSTRLEQSKMLNNNFKSTRLEQSKMLNNNFKSTRLEQSKMLNNNYKSVRLEYQIDKELGSDEESFTFGKPSRSQKR